MVDGTKRQARKIPEATVARLPIYLRSLLEAAGDGMPTISSERLAELSGFNAAKVRKATPSPTTAGSPTGVSRSPRWSTPIPRWWARSSTA